MITCAQHIRRDDELRVVKAKAENPGSSCFSAVNSTVAGKHSFLCIWSFRWVCRLRRPTGSAGVNEESKKCSQKSSLLAVVSSV